MYKCDDHQVMFDVRHYQTYHSRDQSREQGWGSGLRARLPPMCPVFDSRTRCHIYAGSVEFVVVSLPCSEGVFLPPQKTNTSKFQFDLKTVDIIIIINLLLFYYYYYYYYCYHYCYYYYYYYYYYPVKAFFMSFLYFLKLIFNSSFRRTGWHSQI